MKIQPFPFLGQQLRSWRKRRGMTQPALAQRLGRDPARISDLERDLLRSRWGRDRLTLLAEACDAMNLILVLVPRDRLEDVQDIVDEMAVIRHRQMLVPTAFDDLFIDLAADEGLGDEDDRDGDS